MQSGSFFPGNIIGRSCAGGRGAFLTTNGAEIQGLLRVAHVAADAVPGDRNSTIMTNHESCSLRLVVA